VNNQAAGLAVGNDVVGFSNQAAGAFSGNGVLGAGNAASGIGTGNDVTGFSNQAAGAFSGNGVVGVGNQASGIGSGNGVDGFDNQASGAFAGNGVTGDSNIAVGTGAGNAITASNTISVGTGARAGAQNSTAVGSDAQVADAHERSTAIGYGARSEFVDEVSLGAKDGSATYTTPGITSGKSLSRQSGPLEVVTTDSNGHLASDGGAIFSALSELNGGVAIAMAMVNPDLVANETFGIAGNISYWNENVALGFSAVGVVGRNLFGTGERLAVSGAVGVSLEEQSFGRRGSETTVGGRAGAQLTW